MPHVTPFSKSAQRLRTEGGKNEFLVRTISSHEDEAAALLDALEYMGWYYAALLSSDEDYGMEGYRKLTELAGPRGITLVSFRCTPGSAADAWRRVSAQVRRLRPAKAPRPPGRLA